MLACTLSNGLIVPWVSGLYPRLCIKLQHTCRLSQGRVQRGVLAYMLFKLVFVCVCLGGRRPRGEILGSSPSLGVLHFSTAALIVVIQTQYPDPTPPFDLTKILGAQGDGAKVTITIKGVESNTSQHHVCINRIHYFRRGNWPRT